jgi:hypothetical protein
MVQLFKQSALSPMVFKHDINAKTQSRHARIMANIDHAAMTVPHTVAPRTTS